jgi:hypothetical protein
MALLKYRIIVLTLIVSMTGLCGFSQQADMPTIIVFPDDAWMVDHGYMEKIGNEANSTYVPKYEEALIQNREMATAIQAVQQILQDRGFKHEDLYSLIKNFRRERAEEMANAADGDMAEKGLVDELLQQACPDIRIDLDYSVSPRGPRKNIEFKLKAVDAYCNDQIASCEGFVELTIDPVVLALRKVISGKCEVFCQQLINYFMDLRENGRKITIIFRAAEDSSIDFLRDEIGEKEETYNDFLHRWIRNHAVNKVGKKGRQTKNMCEFKNVRIPFFDKNGDPTDADTWSNDIRKTFKAETGVKIVKGQGNALGRINFLVGVN